MENMTAKVSYLKGLCDGLNIDESKPEGKLLVSIIDVLKDMSAALDDVIDAHDELEEKVDEIDKDLADIEDIAYGDDDEDEDDDFSDYDDDMDFFEIECSTLMLWMKKKALYARTAIRRLNLSSTVTAMMTTATADVIMMMNN